MCGGRGVAVVEVWRYWMCSAVCFCIWLLVSDGD